MINNFTSIPIPDEVHKQANDSMMRSKFPDRSGLLYDVIQTKSLSSFLKQLEEFADAWVNFLVTCPDGRSVSNKTKSRARTLIAMKVSIVGKLKHPGDIIDESVVQILILV